MRFGILAVFGVVLTFLGGPSVARAEFLLETYSGVVFGDLDVTGGDTVGRLLVGGDMHMNTGYSVGLAGPFNPFTGEYVGGHPLPQDDPSRDDLIVAGNVTSNSSSQQLTLNGNFVHGGTFSGTGISHWTPGASVVGVSAVTIDPTTGNVDRNGNGLTLGDLRSQYESLSIQLASMDANGTVDSPWELKLTGTDSQLNVFHLDLDQADMFADRGAKIIAPEGSTVIVNIAGSTINNQGSMLALEGIDQSQVIYNFYEATRFYSENGREFTGSVLAAFAEDARLKGGSINGAGIFGGNVTHYGGFEFHNYPFEGTIPAAVPEPGSLTLVGLGALAVLGFRARRRRRRSAA